MLNFKPALRSACAFAVTLAINSFACAEAVVGLPPTATATPAVSAAPTSPAPLQGTRGKAKIVECTPTTIKIGRDRPRATKNPIADAISAAAPGCEITLRGGKYPGFTLGFDKNNARNSRSSGGLPGQPISITGIGDVVIYADASVGDTISINQQVKNGYFTFSNLKIEPGYRAAILFFKLDGGRSHDSFKFIDCSIIGSWDHARNKGKKSKWGVWGHSMKNFEFRGFRYTSRVENIQQEHGFYIQNAQGPILIENVRASRLGRTFCQFTARAKDGPIGIGSITVRNCFVEDIGLFKGDNYKGGSAFTFAGRLTGDILIEKNTYRAGFNSRLKGLTRNDAPYNTGALVCWSGGEKIKNRKVTIKDNDFEFAEGCGDRPVVSIGGCDSVSILGKNRFVSGGQQPALALDPLKGGPGSPPVSPRNGRVFLSPDTELSGRAEMNGRKIGPAQMQKLQTPPARAAKPSSRQKR